MENNLTEATTMLTAQAIEQLISQVQTVKYSNHKADVLDLQSLLRMVNRGVKVKETAPVVATVKNRLFVAGVDVNFEVEE